jgi:hypothetical protein
VTLHITHTADSDLDISLIGPDGTTVGLSSDNGGTASDYGSDCASDATRTTFNDSALTAITAASAPFVGVFRPEQSLSVFNEKFGSAVNGAWRLRVADDTAGGGGSVRCWSLVLSPTACNNAGGGCESCPEQRIIHGLLGVGSQSQDGRLALNGGGSVCGAAKVCPGVLGAGVARHFDSYVFENGESNACISVALTADCQLASATYRNTYNPANLCQNYLADGGTSLAGGTVVYSFNVAARARFVVVVNEVNPDTGCEYKLTVTGGSCRPWLVVTPVPVGLVGLDWSSAAIGYRLERTNVLRNPSTPPWIPVTTQPTIVGGRFRFVDTISLPPTNSFYRLRKP